MKIAFHLDTHEKSPLSSGRDLIKNSSQGHEDPRRTGVGGDTAGQKVKG